MCFGEVEELKEILKPAIHRTEVNEKPEKHMKVDLIEYLLQHPKLQPQK